MPTERNKMLKELIGLTALATVGSVYNDKWPDEVQPRKVVPKVGRSKAEKHKRAMKRASQRANRRKKSKR